MPVVLGQGCQNAKTFRKSHALAYHPSTPSAAIGAFPVGGDFFIRKSAEELQTIIDNTWKMRKSLNFTGGNYVAAKAFLKNASSDGSSNIKVLWGIHQSQNRPLGVIGKCQHFTLDGSPNNWHLYINTNGSKIAFMSDGPASYTQIKKY